MPNFDILAGPSLYDGLVNNGGGSSGFDILAPNPAGRPIPGQGQNGAAQPGGQQPQGAPVSGLVAGMMGMPIYGGALPGASYLTSQAQPNAGQQMDGLPARTPAGAAQPQNNIGSAVGSGLRSLFDGVVGLGR